MALSYDETQIAVDRAVIQAQGALGPWMRQPVHERTALSVRAERLILSGLPWLEAVGSLDLCVEPIEPAEPKAEWLGVLIESRSRGGRWKRIGETELAAREPGVAAVLVPDNYPLALVAVTVVRLLGGGHAVVLAPQGNSGRKVRRLWRTLLNANIPQGVVHVVDSAGATTRLLSHPVVTLALHLGATSAVPVPGPAKHEPGNVVHLPSGCRPMPRKENQKERR
jgi:acyl-CoA reductase-like NAD-dependent aldehyde dehydrogenase